jgi:hypothetical protein
MWFANVGSPIMQVSPKAITIPFIYRINPVDLISIQISALVSCFSGGCGEGVFLNTNPYCCLSHIPDIGIFSQMGHQWAYTAVGMDEGPKDASAAL